MRGHIGRSSAQSKVFNAGLLATMGAQTIADMVAIKKLLFVQSVVSLPQDSLPRQVLSKRLQAQNAKAWLPTMLVSSNTLNLPSPDDLMQQAPSKPVWKRVVTGIIRARASLVPRPSPRAKSKKLFTFRAGGGSGYETTQGQNYPYLKKQSGNPTFISSPK